MAEGKYEAKIEWHEEKVSYQDLCRRCRRTVKNCIDRIFRNDEDEGKKASSKEKAQVITPPVKKGFLTGLAASK